MPKLAQRQACWHYQRSADDQDKPDMIEESRVRADGATIDSDSYLSVMGSFKMTGRYDDSGRFYISVYDVWDVRPAGSDTLFDSFGGLAEQLPQPIDLYYRIYCDPATRQLMPPP